MDLGLKDRVIVIAAERAADRDACKAALARESCHVASIARLDGVAACIEQTLREQGRIDGVVVYLPAEYGRPALGATLQDLRASWSSVEAVAAGFRAAVPAMTELGWGRLVSVMTGGVKWLQDNGDAPGTLAGLGILGMHKAIVADVARFGIATNAVLRNPDASAEEVAATVSFLLSDPAGYLQGVAISLDGAASPAMF
ncbi:MAG: hypothetical protein KKA12_09075 [Alphaproteobacteria bacterium]|nr:hypothetical protein [Alphaproteobacteria bacterium]